MFGWFRRLLREWSGDERERLFEAVDALNEETAGKPTVTERFLGNLRLRSGTLALGDPQYLPALEVPNIAATAVGISGGVWRYPSAAETVTRLTLRLGDETGITSNRKIAELGIDSAKLVVADGADIAEHWTDVGKDRIGVISTAPDDTVLRLELAAIQRTHPLNAEAGGGKRRWRAYQGLASAVSISTRDS